MSSDSTSPQPQQTEPSKRMYPVATPDEEEELDSEGSRPGSLLELEVLNEKIYEFVSLSPFGFQSNGSNELTRLQNAAPSSARRPRRPSRPNGAKQHAHKEFTKKGEFLYLVRRLNPLY